VQIQFQAPQAHVPNPVEGPFCHHKDGSPLETSSGISESALAAKKEPTVLVDTCHGCRVEMTHSQLEYLLDYNRSQCSECGGVQDELCSMFPQAAATKHRLVPGGELRIRKLSYESQNYCQTATSLPGQEATAPTQRGIRKFRYLHCGRYTITRRGRCSRIS
jgi:hypothetical protein